MNKKTIVQLQGVVKKFDNFTAVAKLDLAIYQGEFLAIMGSSGCGKTTCLRMIAGLETPSEGSITMYGNDISNIPTWKRETPLVWQSLALFPFLDVEENVAFALRMAGMAKTKRIKIAHRWLERLDILPFAKRNIAQLSGGQRQRVALARALVTEPKILLLDEPLSALDANLKVRMQSLLSNLQKDLGITFVYVTHSQSEAFSMADRVVIMDKGKIEQIGTPEEIYHTPYNRFVAEFLGSANILEGTLAQKKANSWLLKDGNRRYEIVAGKKPMKIGDKVIFSVSSENMILMAGDKAGKQGKDDNSIMAVVVGQEFVGATNIIFLETADGRELKVQQSHRKISQLNIAIGKKLMVRWDKNHCHILEERS